MRSLSRAEVHIGWASLLRQAAAKGPEYEREVLRELGRKDLFFLLVKLLNRPDIDDDWLFDRCNEVQADPDGRLDLWAREHYKSTIITFGLTIQDILNDPEITIGIFSNTRPGAKKFLRQIKFEFEDNKKLKELYPDILWEKPQSQAPKWNEDDGIVVKRKGNPKEATVEAWGLIDGMPTGAHFKLRVYDDVVTEKNVTTAEQIKKTIQAWELSQNLGAHGGRVRYIGTRYHALDAYRTMLERGSAIPRIHPATDDGKPEGVPVFLTREALAIKRRDMGPYVFGCQMLQDPVADEVQGFKEEWLEYWEPTGWAGWNLYMLVDPASKKKATNDYTSIFIIGLAQDQNTYVIDMVRDRLNLTQRASKVIELHRKYHPVAVGYEEYGLQADIEHIKHVQKEQNYRFNIIALGGQQSKENRIRRMVPDFEQGRVFLPYRCMAVDYQKKIHDLTQEFVREEFLLFPVGSHDDMLDALCRIKDEALGAVYPDATARHEQNQAITDYNPMDGVPQQEQRVSGMDYNPI